MFIFITIRNLRLNKGTSFASFSFSFGLLTHHFFSYYVIVQLFSFLCTGPSRSRSHTYSQRDSRHNRPRLMSCSHFWLSLLCYTYSACTIILSYKFRLTHGGLEAMNFVRRTNTHQNAPAVFLISLDFWWATTQNIPWKFNNENKRVSHWITTQSTLII